MTLSVNTQGTKANYTLFNGTNWVSGERFQVTNCDNSFDFTITFSYTNYYNCMPDKYPDPAHPQDPAWYIQHRTYRNIIYVQEEISSGNWSTIHTFYEYYSQFSSNDIINNSETWYTTLFTTEKSYRVVIEKENWVYRVNSGVNPSGYYEVFLYSTIECRKEVYFKLKHVKRTPSITSTLTENGNSHQPNGYGTAFYVCGPTNINLTTSYPLCQNQWAMYLEVWNGTGFSLLSNTGNLSGTPPSVISVNTYFPQVSPGNTYRLFLKVGKNGVWSGNTTNMFTFEYKQSYYPTIVAPNEICSGDMVTLNVQNYSGNPNGISWSTGHQDVDHISVSPNTTTTYSVNFTEVCTQSPAAKTIVVHPLPSIDLSMNDDAFCMNDPNDFNPWNLTAQVSPQGGSGSWSSSVWNISPNGYFDPNAQSVSLPATGSATYTYTDINGCSNSETFTFGYYNESTLNTTVINISCYGANDGKIYTSAAGYPLYDFSLSPNPNQSTTPPFTNLPPGNYTVELTDAHNCVTTSNTLLVSQPANPVSASLSISSPASVACNGDLKKVHFTNVSGGTPGYQYNFGNGFSSSPYGKLPAGNHTLTVKDANNCSLSFPFTVNQPAPLSSSFITYDATCKGIDDGMIVANTNGGTPPYSYQVWGQGSFSSNLFQGLPGGTYTVTTTDNYGCTDVVSGVHIANGPSGILTSSTVSDESCTGIGDGEIVVSPASYNYNWSNGATSNGISGLLAGNYMVTITDPGTGCQEVITYSVNNIAAPKWHKASYGLAGNIDRIVKVLTDPATNDVYVLGEFKGLTKMDYVFDAGVPGSEGIFIVKYDECGTPVWGVHSNYQGAQTFNIKALDLQFNGSSVRVYGQWDNVNGGVNFNMINTVSQNQIQVLDGNSLNNVFSMDISPNGGLSSVSAYTLNYDDIIHQVVYHSGSNETYFAGQFDNGGQLQAGVKKSSGGSSTTNIIIDSQTGNEIRAIEFIGNDLYAVANLWGVANFGSGNIAVNGQQEAVILKWSGSNITHVPAGASGFVSVNDIATDGTNLWVALEFDVELGNWSGLNSNSHTAMVLQFSPNLQPMQSFFIDENATGGFQSASANAISIVNNQMYVAGTFTGSSLVIGNTTNGFTNPSTITGSGSSADLWLAKFDLQSNQFVWIEGSESQDPVSVTDIAYDGRNAYMTGSFLENIDFQGNVTNINHPQPGTFYSGYVIRGGDFLSSGGQGQYYKTGHSSSFTSQSTSVEEATSALVVYPNPNNGTFTIQYNGQGTGLVRIAIYDVTGRLVFHQKYDKSGTEFTQTISPEQCAPGIYMLGMEINGETQYQKLIVQ